MPPLFDGLCFDALIADMAFDSNAIIADLNERGTFKRIAMRADKTDISFNAIIRLAAAVISSR